MARPSQSSTPPSATTQNIETRAAFFLLACFQFNNAAFARRLSKRCRPTAAALHEVMLCLPGCRGCSSSLAVALAALRLALPVILAVAPLARRLALLVSLAVAPVAETSTRPAKSAKTKTSSCVNRCQAGATRSPARLTG
jgi:hypothetical protein